MYSCSEIIRVVLLIMPNIENPNAYSYDILIYPRCCVHIDAKLKSRKTDSTVVWLVYMWMHGTNTQDQ